MGHSLSHFMLATDLFLKIMRILLFVLTVNGSEFITEVQYKQRPNLKCRAVDFWNEQKRLCRRAKSIIGSWFQG